MAQQVTARRKPGSKAQQAAGRKPAGETQQAAKREPAGKTKHGDREVRAIIIDDQLVFRLGLRSYLERAMPELTIVGETGSTEEGIALAGQTTPDLVLLGASLENHETCGTLRELREAAPDSRVVLLSNVPNYRDFALALSGGADGYVLKSIAPKRLVAGLREVAAGTLWVQPELARQMYHQVFLPSEDGSGRPAAAQPLTPRQIEVLELVTRGLRNADIADQLKISEQTVKTHIAHLLRKLGVKSRLQAAHYAIRHKLVEI
jgi:two-component system nitrate/nitrite response regulator NarL